MKAQRLIAQSKWLVVMAVFSLVVGIAGTATAASFSYLNFAGTSFSPRDSSVTVTYGGGGCINLTGGSQVITKLQLPNDAVIHYIRLYYDVNDPSKVITMWLTKYDTGTAATSDIISASSPVGSAGSGTILSADTSETVDNATFDYVLIGIMPQGTNVQLCGVRVAYYQPPYLIIE